MFKNLNSNTYKKVGTLSNVPNNVSYLSTKPNENIDKVTIGIKYNKDIQHISIENYKAKEYYENYFMTLSYSDDIQNLQHAQLKKLLDLSRKYTNDCDLSFIEIGCGDGDFLLKASNIFKNTVGVEPSEKFSNFAKNRGLSIINKYINSEEKGGVIGSEKFNAFASRQVFEHLEDPLNVLLGIKKNLKKNAVGLIEVPNGANSYRSGRFYDFFPDHINYYSINSIVSLATSAGFNVLSCNEALNGDYIELWLLNNDGSNYFSKLKKKKEKITRSLLEYVNSIDSKISIWGCGAKTLSILSSIDSSFLDKVKFVIDSDVNKHNLYIPCSSIQVVSDKDAVQLGVGIIMVLALSHSTEIYKQIRVSFPANTIVVSIDSNGDIFDMDTC